jgi:hypothetical protein
MNQAYERITGKQRRLDNFAPIAPSVHLGSERQERSNDFTLELGSDLLFMMSQSAIGVPAGAR